MTRALFYPQLQIIVTADGAAGINFEHTGVDGHTVLRCVSPYMALCSISLCYVNRV